MPIFLDTILSSQVSLPGKTGFFLTLIFFIKKCFLSLYIYFERERQRDRVGEGKREGERESQVGFALSARSLMWGLNTQTVRS